MSWWDAKQFTSLASNAFKNAQKKIDKVLDIPTEEEPGNTAVPAKGWKEESEPANSSWSAWGTPASFLSSTPKSSTFSEPTGRSSPTLSQDSPRSTKSSNSSSPKVSLRVPPIVTPTSPSPVAEDLSLNVDSDPIATSSPAVPSIAEAKADRRRPRRQRSDDKPQTTKKLGAVKLGAVKVKKMEKSNPESTISSDVDDEKKDEQEVVDNDQKRELAVHKDGTATLASPSLTEEEETRTVSDVIPDTDSVDQTVTEPLSVPSAVTDPLPDIQTGGCGYDSVDKHDTSAISTDSLPDVAAADSVAPSAADTQVVELSPHDLSKMGPEISEHIIEEPSTPGESAQDMSRSESMSLDLLVESTGSDYLIVSNKEEVVSLPPVVKEEGVAVSDGEEVTNKDVGEELEEKVESGEITSVSESASELTLQVENETGAGETITKSTSSDNTVTDQEADSVSAPPGDDDENEMEASTAPSIMEQSSCSDKSYVKCELPSPALNRVDSGQEFYKGAPSEYSDFETATSSDIEIISMASTFGDGNGEARMMDFVPLSRSVFKTKIRDIPAGEELSLCSPQISPSCSDQSGSVSPPPTSHATENPLDSQVLLKKLSHLTEVLEARETKLLALSTEHGELLEVNAHLKRRIEQMEETNGALDLVKDEFGQRLHELERKLQNALREKELIKKQLMTTQEELHNRAGTSGKMQRLVEEKDEQISSLMAEGEKLAKQQLQSNNLIKKLRKKEKEQEELSRTQREKISSQTNELERLKAVLDSKIQNETKHSELIKQLNSAVSTYQSENQKLKTEAEEALEKQKRAESAVDNSYKEIAELHKAAAAKDTLIKELKLGNETQHREELQIALEKKQKEALRDADHLTSQIEDMQLTISRMEKEQHRREACLRQENQDLLDKLENSDKRNDELTQSVTAATKPLLRQIENLQSSYSAQSSSWEKLERSLTERLAEAQNQLVSATERERVSSENSLESSSRLNVLETQLTSLKQEKSRLSAELEMCKMKVSTLQDERNSAVTQLDTYKSSMETDRVESKKSYTLLENKLELEKTKLEAEKKKYLVIMEQLNEKEQQLNELRTSRSRNTPSPTVTNEEGRASHSMKRSMKQEELLERALSTSTSMGTSLYDNMRNHSTTSLLESLESQVKQREGEIGQLQADILEHEKTRESLTKEMVKLTEENSIQESKIRQLSKLQNQYKELNSRYQALLQMYGEKEEQVTELRMDLMDVKQMYKQQIDALLSK